MRGLLQSLCCLAWFGCVAAAQTGSPSPEELLDRGKQLYTQEGPKAALPILDDALRSFRAKDDRHGEAVALGYVANCYRKLEKLDKALELAQQALQMKQDLHDSDEVGKTHNQLGLIYWDRADYPSAIRQFQMAINIAGSVPDKQLEGSARNNLGLVFDEQGNYEQSLVQYKQALELHRATHFERGEGDTLGNIGGVYLLLGKFSEALPYYQQALAISERLGLKPASSDDLGNIALCLSATGDVDGALKVFDRALSVAHDAGLAKEEAEAKGQPWRVLDVSTPRSRNTRRRNRSTNRQIFGASWWKLCSTPGEWMKCSETGPAPSHAFSTRWHWRVRSATLPVKAQACSRWGIWNAAAIVSTPLPRIFCWRPGEPKAPTTRASRLRA